MSQDHATGGDGSATRRHVFISHHHADDTKVDQLTQLLAKGGNDIRNSSVRMKPANQRRMNEGRVKDETIKRLLRMKISWAATVVVLIGKDTHSRPWVNWEIEQAAKQGKRIVGVYAHGGTDAEKPEALERYGAAIVAWNTDSIVNAIDGANNFENSDGTSRNAVHPSTTRVC
ncbi:MAG: TIR domain-containing protein [Acidobacteriaceae bacterium]